MRFRIRRGTLEDVVHVGQRKGDVLRLRGEDFHREVECFTSCPRGCLARGQIPQQRHATRAHDTVRGLGDDAVHATNAAGFHAHGVIRDVEIGLFEKPMALDHEQEILCPERLACADDAGEQVVQHGVPDLPPCFPSRPAERVRMLGPEDRAIGVIVKDGELGSPEQNNLRFRRQQHADNAAQALWPRLDRPERSFRPIEAPHQGPQFTAAGQDRVCPVP